MTMTPAAGEDDRVRLVVKLYQTSSPAELATLLCGASMTAEQRERIVQVPGGTLPTDLMANAVRAILNDSAAVPLLAVIGVSLRYVRISHSLQDYSLEEKRITYLLGSTFAGGDLGYSVFLRAAMTHFPGSQPYLLGRSYYRLLFVPIPRWVWPNKPDNTQRVFARVLDPALGDKGTTIPPGIVGDLYINFGHAGILGMLVFGLFFGRERYRQFSDIIFLAGSGTWLFHLVRGGFTNPLLTLVFIWLLSHMLSRMISPARITVPKYVAPWSSRSSSQQYSEKLLRKDDQKQWRMSNAE